MAMAQELNFETVTNPPAELQTQLWERLHAHGTRQLGRPDLQETISLATIVRHQAEIVGGLLAAVFYRGYNLQLLWVSEDYRGHGLGRRLLESAERQARTHQCTVIFGYSFGFQAPDFYLRAGYQLFGVIEDFPQGHHCHFLCKRLESAVTHPA